MGPTFVPSTLEAEAQRSYAHALSVSCNSTRHIMLLIYLKYPLSSFFSYIKKENEPTTPVIKPKYPNIFFCSSKHSYDTFSCKVKQNGEPRAHIWGRESAIKEIKEV